MLRRSPHGERGLKFEDGDYDFEVTKSLSSRRAWIEIISPLICLSSIVCRSPHGERGLKLKKQVYLSTQVYVALLTESVD